MLIVCVYNHLFPPPSPLFFLFCLCVSLSLSLSLSPFLPPSQEEQWPPVSYNALHSVSVLQKCWLVWSTITDAWHSILKHPTLNVLGPLFPLELLLAQPLADNHYSSQEVGAAPRNGGPGLTVDTPRGFTLEPPRPFSLILHQHPVTAFCIHSPKQDVTSTRPSGPLREPSVWGGHWP